MNEVMLKSIREDFHILKTKIRGRQLVYLDNAATTHKPQQVIDALNQYYFETNSNVHRGIHTLSQNATDAYEAVRELVKTFIHATSSDEIIFTRGTTEAINLVAQTYGRTTLKAGDEVIISEMEHHSNLVPWQVLCEQTGASLRVIAVTDKGEVDLDHYASLLNSKTKVVALAHVSNALGSVNPIKQMIKMAHDVNAVTLIDGAQAAPHMPIDVQDLGCDFYTFSGHKMYAPMGVGVLYGKTQLLDRMPPYQTGGGMISRVTFEKTEYAKSPAKFEAGTPNVGAAVGLGEAIHYMNRIGLSVIAEHEQRLLSLATSKLENIEGIRIIGTTKTKAAVISFVMDDVHPHDIGTILDNEGIAIRAGHHCAMPLMERFKVPATARVSFGLYNTAEEVNAFAEGLKQVKQVFA